METMEPLRQRSQMLLEIVHDLSIIQNRLTVLEDQFEDDGLVARIAEAAHMLAVKLEALETKINARAE